MGLHTRQLRQMHMHDAQQMSLHHTTWGFQLPTPPPSCCSALQVLPCGGWRCVRRTGELAKGCGTSKSFTSDGHPPEVAASDQSIAVWRSLVPLKVAAGTTLLTVANTVQPPHT